MLPMYSLSESDEVRLYVLGFALSHQSRWCSTPSMQYSFSHEPPGSSHPCFIYHNTVSHLVLSINKACVFLTQRNWTDFMDWNWRNTVYGISLLMILSSKFHCIFFLFQTVLISWYLFCIYLQTTGQHFCSKRRSYQIAQRCCWRVLQEFVCVCLKQLSAAGGDQLVCSLDESPEFQTDGSTHAP